MGANFSRVRAASLRASGASALGCTSESSNPLVAAVAASALPPSAASYLGGHNRKSKAFKEVFCLFLLGVCRYSSLLLLWLSLLMRIPEQILRSMAAIMITVSLALPRPLGKVLRWSTCLAFDVVSQILLHPLPLRLLQIL